MRPGAAVLSLFCILHIPIVTADEGSSKKETSPAVTDTASTEEQAKDPKKPEPAPQQPKEQKKADAPQAQAVKSSAAFIRELNDKPRADYSDSMRIIMTLLQNKDPMESFEATRKSLMDKNIIPASWNYRKDSPVTKGMVAYMLCASLNIKGGMTMRLLGNTERYALRECIWIGLIMGGNQNEYVTGQDLLGIFSRSAIYKKDGNLKALQ